MKSKFPKIIYFLLCFLLIFEQSGFAQVAGELDISGHFLQLQDSLLPDKFRPLHLRYLSYDTLNNNFKLLLDKGDFNKGLSPKGTVPEEKLKEQTRILLNYLFIGISLPNDSFWVNLRPDSPENIIDPYLAQTDVGKILLEADLQLKKDTAKFTSPENPKGKEYWEKLYKKAGELFGSENITIPTLTRPWIVPGEIIIRETSDNAYVYKATLKVMLEQDYLKDSAVYNFKDERLKALNEYSSQLIRELIIPKLTQEVNNAKRYAPLRQVYYSLILAQWFKARFYGKGGLYSWLIDKKNLNGITSQTPWSKATYFEAYQRSFKEGEYNIKEPVYTPSGQSVRSYFSGGIAINLNIGASGAARGSVASPVQFIAGNLARDIVNVTSSSINPRSVLQFKGGIPEDPFDATSTNIAGLPLKNEGSSSPAQSTSSSFISQIEAPAAIFLGGPGAAGGDVRTASANNGRFAPGKFTLRDKLRINVSDILQEDIDTTLSDLDTDTRKIVAKALRKDQNSHRFLSLAHPLVRELQKILDNMAETGLPRTHILVAVDGEEPLAKSFGYRAIINLSLISKLETIDELAAILAHEQGHQEFNATANYAPHDIFEAIAGRISADRMQEHIADLVVPAKLAKLGLYTHALSDALSKIAGNRSQQDVTHGNVSRRNLFGMFMHRKFDFEAGDRQKKTNIPIPDNWKSTAIKPSITELLNGKYSNEFRDAVGRALLITLTAAIGRVLEAIIYFRIKDEKAGKENVHKLLFMMNNVVERIEKVAKRQGWTEAQQNGAILTIFNFASGSSMHWSYFISRDASGDISKIQSLLEEKATSVMSDLDNVWPFLQSLTKPGGEDDYGLDLLVDSSIYGLFELFADAVIYNAKVRSRIITGASDIDDPNWLVIVGSYLMKLSSLKNAPFMQMASLVSTLNKALAVYTENFWGSHEENKENLLFLINQLRSINAQWEESLHLSFTDLEAIYKSYVMHSDGKSGLLIATIHQHLVSDEEAMELILQKKDQRIEEFTEIMETRNEDRLVNFIAEQKASCINLLKQRKVKNLLDSDHLLSPWIASVMQRRWYTESMVISIVANSNADKTRESILSYNWFIDKFDLRRQMYQNGDQVDLKDDDSGRMFSFAVALEIVKALPVKEAQQRFLLVSSLLNSPEAEQLFESVPWVFLAYVVEHMADIFQGLYDASPYNPYDYYDRILNSVAFRRLRDKVQLYIGLAEDLAYARQLREYIINSSGRLYGQKEQYSRIGVSEHHGAWLAPVNAAYFQRLQRDSQAILTLSDTKLAANYYFILRQDLPDGPRKERILKAIARKIIDTFNHEDLKVFLVRLSEEGAWDKDTYDYFVQKKINTVSDFYGFKQLFQGQLNRIAATGSLKLSGLVLLDSMLDRMLNAGLAKKLFQAMMGSASDDRRLRLVLAPFWFMASNALGEALGYSIFTKGGRFAIEGSGQNNFMPFEKFMHSLYDAPTWTKFLIMEKLLLSPNGILHTKEGRQFFTQSVTANLPKESMLSDLLSKVLTASIAVLDAVRIFFLFHNSLATLFLQKPNLAQPSSLSETAEAIVSKWEGLARSEERSIGEVNVNKIEKFLQDYQMSPEPSHAMEIFNGMLDSLSAILERTLNIPYQETAAQEIITQNAIDPLGIILETCQNLGPVGVRFLQILGQYFPLTPAQQERFRDVYDAAEGQDKISAFNTLLEAAKHYPEVKKFVEEDLISIDAMISRGSIVTVFLVTVRNRDSYGNIIAGTHQEVVKIRAPNAEGLVGEISDKALEIVEYLRLNSSGQEKKNYEIAKRILQVIKEWVIQDIRDDTFIELDPRYQSAHENYFARNGMAVRVLPSFLPNNKDVKREAFVPGITLNKLLKLKLTGKPLAELILEENNPQVREFLQQAVDQKVSLEEALSRAIGAVVDDYARHLFEPIFTNQDGQDVYLLHSDLHLGNVIISPDLKTAYLIDRNLYLRLNQADVEFMRRLTIAGKEHPIQLLSAVIEYFLNLPENRQNILNKQALKGIRTWVLTRAIGFKIKMSGEGDMLSFTMKIMQELEALNIVVPIKVRILFKNLISISNMLEIIHSDAFGEYVQAAQNYYKNRAQSSFDSTVQFASSAVSEKQSAASPLTEAQQPAASSPAATGYQQAMAQLNEFIDAIKKGKYQQKAVVDLRNLPPGVEVILAGDFHARLDNLKKILNNNDNLKKIQRGEAILVILGDAVHSETNLKEMDSSVEIMRFIMDLKIQNPHSVYYLLGNHDYLSSLEMKDGVQQGLLYWDRLEYLYGTGYIDSYDNFIKASPLMAIGNGFIATHAGPIKGATYSEIQDVDVANEESNIVRQAERGRYGERFGEEDIRKFLHNMGQPEEASLIVGHSPTRDGDWHWRPLPNSHFHIIFAGHDRAGYAYIQNGQLDFTEVTNVSPNLELVDSAASPVSGKQLEGAESTSSPLGQQESTPSAVEDSRKRLTATIERGTGWIRVAATPDEAYNFHKNYSSNLAGSYKAEFEGKSYNFPLKIWDKMVKWSEKSSDFERKGYFLVRKSSNNVYEVIDFMPVGSIAADPDMYRITDSLTTQVADANINSDLAEALGFNLRIQEKLSFLSVKGSEEDLVSIPFHSHHIGSAYTESPSEADKLETKNRTSFLYSLKNRRGFIYSGENYKEIKQEIISSPAGKNSVSPAIQTKDTKGGIDLRALPIVTQAMQGNLIQGQPPKNILGPVPISMNLDVEWQQIEKMAQAGLIPSNERIREYLQASCRSEDCSQRIDKVLSLFADILRLEEERVVSTDLPLKEMLALLESDKPAAEMQFVLAKIIVLEKEPLTIAQ